MTEFSLFVLLLGLPGIACLSLTNHLVGRMDRSTLETIFVVFLYSILSYLLVFCFGWLIELTWGVPNILVSSLAPLPSPDNTHLGFVPQISLNFFALFLALIGSVITAYLVAYAVRYNLANRIGMFIGATTRYGDQDVWHYFHHIPEEQKNDGWVVVRDLKQGLTYSCYITTWSDSGETRELLLSEVSVFESSTAEHLYDVRHIYISRNFDDIIIEIPPPNAENQDAWKLNQQSKEN